MSHHHHNLKRLQPTDHSNSHERRSTIPNDDEVLRESINDELVKISRAVLIVEIFVLKIQMKKYRLILV